MRLSFAQVACFVVCAWCCGASSLHAQTRLAGESWLAVRASDDPCIEERSLARDVLSLLGGTAVPVGVQVRVEARGKVAKFTLWHGSGAVAERELQDLPSSCAARKEAVSLALALAIEHALAAESAASGAELEPGEPPRESQAAQDHVEPRPAEVRPKAAREVYLGVMGGLGVGRLPSLTAEGLLNVEWVLGPYLALEASTAVSSRSRVPLAEGTLATRLFGAALGTCLGGATGAGRLAGCLSAGFDMALGEGRGLAQNARDITASSEFALAVAGRWPIRSRFALVWRVEGFVRWLRPRFEVFDASGQVVEPRTFPAGGGRLLLGMAWRVR